MCLICMLTFAYTDRENLLSGLLTKGEQREEQSHVLLPPVEHWEGGGLCSLSSQSQKREQQAGGKGNAQPPPFLPALATSACPPLCGLFLSRQKLRLCHVPSGEALPLDHTLETWITKEDCPLYNGGNVILEYLNDEEQFLKNVDSYLEQSLKDQTRIYKQKSFFTVSSYDRY